jgi:hypothetical protein
MKGGEENPKVITDIIYNKALIGFRIKIKCWTKKMYLTKPE